MNWHANTTHTNAMGYVAAYADATSSVPVTPISVPNAGVLVIPPVIEPKLLRRESFKTYFAKTKPTIRASKHSVLTQGLFLRNRLHWYSVSSRTSRERSILYEHGWWTSQLIRHGSQLHIFDHNYASKRWNQWTNRTEKHAKSDIMDSKTRIISQRTLVRGFGTKRTGQHPHLEKPLKHWVFGSFKLRFLGFDPIFDHNCGTWFFKFSLIQFNISGCGAVGSARHLGCRCRRFEPCHSDQKTVFPLRKHGFLCIILIIKLFDKLEFVTF